jgi:Putative Flp pilus-assembly TadE/G-like
MKWFRDQKEQVQAMVAFKKRFQSARNEEGQTLVLTALSLTVLLGFLALATDAGVMLRQKRIAQSVADSAAIAGAFEALYEGTPSSVTTGMWNAAAKDATLNGYAPGTANGVTNSTNGVTLSLSVTPNIGVSTFNSAGYVQANVTFNSPTFFMTLFKLNSLNVSAAAIASNQLQAAGCFDIQNASSPQADPAGSMSGASEVFGTTCGVTVNGNLDMGGSSNIDAKYVAVSGQIQNTGNGSSITGTTTQGAPPTNDPLSQLQTPADQPTVNAAAGTCTAPAGAVGYSCVYNYLNGNLTGTVNLTSKTIYVFDGNVTTTCGQGKQTSPCVNVGGTLSGTNVTLYLMNNIEFDFASNGSVNLTAPAPPTGSTCLLSTNPFCGVLIDAPTDGSTGGTTSCSTGKGNNDGNPGELYFDFGSSNSILTGVIYAPSMQLFVQDQGSSTTLNNDVIIGNFCSQSGTVTINGLSPSLSPLARIGLVY